MRSRAMGAVALAIGAGPLGQLNIGATAEILGAPLAVRVQALVAVLAIALTLAALPDSRERLK